MIFTEQHLQRRKKTIYLVMMRLSGEVSAPLDSEYSLTADKPVRALLDMQHSRGIGSEFSLGVDVSV